MSYFYTNCTAFGDEILVRGYKDGIAYTKKVKFRPSLYVESINTSATSKYFTIFDKPLRRHDFDTIKDAKMWATGLKNEKIPVYGCDKYHYQYLGDEFLGQDVLADFSLIKIQAVDIETTVHITGKFPSVINPLEEILLLTFIDSTTKQKNVFGRKPYKSADPLVTFHHYEDEREMLHAVIAFWRKTKIDIITGWNSEDFDIPYICARIELLLGSESLKKLSPFGQVWTRDGIDDFGKEKRTYNIVGVSQLDYLLLYKKFNLKKQASYKLGHIGFVELKKPKLELDMPFYDAYTYHWDKYVLYNIIDTEIVDELEGKKKFIRLAVMLAHMAKCSFEDTLGTVAMWESIIYNYLFVQNKIIPMSNNKPAKDIVGAVVKEPVAGFYKWAMGVDATSLYPSILMMLNMSPETIIDDEFVKLSIQEFMAMKSIGTDRTVACNGHVFRNDKRGCLPVLVERYFNLRVEYKDKKKSAEQKAKNLKAVLTDDNRAEYEKYQLEADINDLYQQAVKIAINSLYGACANKHFIFFDTRIAEGITMTGQAIIQYTQNKINDYLDGVCGTTGYDYGIMGDTDSCVFTLAPLIKKYYADTPEDQLIDIVSKIGKTRIEPYLNKVCDEFTEYLNGNAGKLRFKREAICSDFIITGKKRYAAKVLDNEYVRYREPEYKIVGLSIVATTCPDVCKKGLKDAVIAILNGASNSDITKHNNTFKKLFFAQKPEDISIPKGVSGVDKYILGNGFVKGTPIQSRAAILFNRAITKFDLTAVYPSIKEGNKIKYIYLKVPNVLQQNVIGYSEKLPVEFGLHKYVDYDTMYEKTYMAQMTSLMQAMNWIAVDKGSFDF